MTAERLYERYVTRDDADPTADTETVETQLGAESRSGADSDECS